MTHLLDVLPNPWPEANAKILGYLLIAFWTVWTIAYGIELIKISKETRTL